jgi:hypothetical protein
MIVMNMPANSHTPSAIKYNLNFEVCVSAGRALSFTLLPNLKWEQHSPENGLICKSE